MIPEWQRPVYSQRIRRHPIPIDFFPWPALRDRLIRHHNYYFATSEFSIHYRQHFKFSWPFSFDDTYHYEPETKTYSTSPLFERYHRDMRCWSLEQVFFEKFPEFKGSIGVYEAYDHQRPSFDMDGMDLSQPSRPGGDMDQDIEIQQHIGLQDECVMELFNDYPPT